MGNKGQKLIKRVFLPDLSRKHWELYNKALHSKCIIGKYIAHLHAKRIQRSFVSDIPIHDSVQPFSTPHGLSGIFISAGAHIGKDCVIFQQVTIGSNTLKDSKGFGSPCIGNNVYIGAGAKIIGNVTIGDGVRIGANCVVTQSVPDNATVVMQKCRVIEQEKPRSNSFVSWNES